MFSATSIYGPWERQAVNPDVNCENATAPICGGYGGRTTNRDELVFNAQWWGPSFIPLADGSTQVRPSAWHRAPHPLPTTKPRRV